MKRWKSLVRKEHRPPPPHPSPAAGFALQGRGRQFLNTFLGRRRIVVLRFVVLVVGRSDGRAVVRVVVGWRRRRFGRFGRCRALFPWRLLLLRWRVVVRFLRRRGRGLRVALVAPPGFGRRFVVGRRVVRHARRCCGLFRRQGRGCFLSVVVFRARWRGRVVRFRVVRQGFRLV